MSKSNLGMLSSAVTALPSTVKGFRTFFSWKTALSDDLLHTVTIICLIITIMTNNKDSMSHFLFEILETHSLQKSSRGAYT